MTIFKTLDVERNPIMYNDVLGIQYITERYDTNTQCHCYWLEN